MYTRHICVSVNERIADCSAENSELGMMLGEFAEVCEADGRNAVSAAEKNGKKYIIDWIHDKRTVKYTVPRICDAIQKYNITELRFEKNNGGALFMEDVKEEFRNRGYFHCRCYEKAAPVKIHKEDKIKAYADWIKDNFLFLMPNRGITAQGAFKRSEDYEKALLEVNMFTAEGKNSSDDAPDSLTQLAMIFEDKFVTPPSRVISSPC